METVRGRDRNTLQARHYSVYAQPQLLLNIHATAVNQVVAAPASNLALYHL